MARRMAAQPGELDDLLADDEPAHAAAAALRDRRVLLVGTGTSWHAANHGRWLLRHAGLEAGVAQAADADAYDLWRTADVIVVLSHRNTKHHTSRVRDRARAAGKTVIVIGAAGSGADIEAGAPERSAAFTGSHSATLLRLAQIARAAGARLERLAEVPAAVAEALELDLRPVVPPARLLEFTGAGPNQWTAAEGALKTREASYVAADGLAVEQLLHGPIVALDERDTLVALDGGGPLSGRLEQVAAAAETAGLTVHRRTAAGLGEPLSIFPLTVAVQRIALGLAAQLGTDPDEFRVTEKPVWRTVPL
jgi:glucosamine--fructose-6-phosphate aminotransferase (isomerizing)